MMKFKRENSKQLQNRTPRFGGRKRAALGLIFAVACTLIASGCGTSSSSSSSSQTGNGPLTANWQFQMTTDGSFATLNNPSCTPTGNTLCLGGFLQQSKGAVTGQLAYAISVTQGVFCNAGTAIVTGTVSGQNVNLTLRAGNETFTLTGALSADNSTIAGTYSSDAQGCGNAQPATTPWSATLVPTVGGAVQGNFHSSAQSPSQLLVNQDYAVTGTLTQGPNTGASSATVTGTLNFNNYPCVSTASVSGSISGNTISLQVIGLNGVSIGGIGTTDTSPVTFQSSAGGGFTLLGSNGYRLSTSQCSSGDQGNVCLGVGNTKACTQPITLSPAFLAFPAQLLGAPATSQKVTLTNTDPSGSTLNNLNIVFTSLPGSQNFPLSDFDGVANFTETDNCYASPGDPSFSLAPQQSCTITVSFGPQQSCPWIPLNINGNPGIPPSQCPPFLGTSVASPPELNATLSVTGVSTPTYQDPDDIFNVPINGLGQSLIQPSTPEIDFGAEAQAQGATPGEVSPPQSVSFTNQGNTPVQILPPGGCASPLPRPVTPGSVSGLQVVVGGQIQTNGSSITYLCDIDTQSAMPNFQITADTCSNALLMPQQSCSVSLVYAPQPGTPQTPALDYVLELNTNRCGDGSPNCEIDSGRFPVELKANPPSPLRMSPGAGLEFGVQPKGQESFPPLTLTLFNDPKDPNSHTITFLQKIFKGADYSVIDNCGTTLAPGSSCPMQVTFTPSISGFDQGSITLVDANGPVGQSQVVHLRGIGQ